MSLCAALARRLAFLEIITAWEGGQLEGGKKADVARLISVRRATGARTLREDPPPQAAREPGHGNLETFQVTHT